jgi:hypothetical protein
MKFHTDKFCRLNRNIFYKVFILLLVNKSYVFWFESFMWTLFKKFVGTYRHRKFCQNTQKFSVFFVVDRIRPLKKNVEILRANNTENLRSKFFLFYKENLSVWNCLYLHNPVFSLLLMAGLSPVLDPINKISQLLFFR